jgi:hypothetical protein
VAGAGGWPLPPPQFDGNERETTCEHSGAYITHRAVLDGAVRWSATCRGSCAGAAFLVNYGFY